MANEQEAGSIIIALRAQIENLQKGMTTAKRVLEGFGQGVQGAAATVNKAGGQMAQTFDEIDRRSIRLSGRMALLTNRLLGLQIIMQTIGTRFQGSRFSQEVQVITDGLTAFGSIVSIMPNKVGLVVGGLAALGATFANLVGPTKKEREEMERVLQLLNNLDAARKKIASTRNLSEQDFQRRRRLGVTGEGTDELERQNNDLNRLIQQRESYLEELAVVTAKLDARVLEIDGPPMAAGEREKLIDDINRLESFVTDLNGKIADGQLKKAFSEINKEMRDFVTLTQQGAKNAEILIEHGLISPIQALQIEAHQTEQQLQRVFEFQAQLEKISPGAGGALNTKIAEGISKLKADREKLGRALEVDRMANNLSSAVGEGIVSGILSGKSAMETLADVGRNLMENALRDAVTFFQEGMTSAFKALTGVAGVELGGLITGLVGIAGGLLAQRERKGSDTFGTIRSQIESSQAVRGIIAGPKEIAVASVGESIGREFKPILGVLIDIRNLIARSGRGSHAGGGFGYAGTVPTT